ncbi:nucleotide pyrophosphohydrolase [bacterium]|nr:nucleotide pyrophosphohydrolase [bacterium]
MDELQRICLKYRDDRDWKQFHNPKDLTLALAIEVSEVLEHFRFKDNNEIEQYLANGENKKKVGYEIADILYFILLLSDEIGIDLVKAFKEKMKIAEGKYPVHLARGSNKKYNELAEFAKKEKI